ncbi:hypothetical protein [Breznakiella homolactica]|uniref:Uncharacterized protein n=1 Tax=Breznakiella homolactica TaxID=2798577 RepID=A0A7T8BBH5_9SPIR|nr:hypothetical protein [Breznakiella homolactica]QQO10040.1 hypothetical protein JFL75_03750 [Breznakiella homolactica]
MKNILRILFILMFSAQLFSLGTPDDFSLDYIILHKEIPYNGDIYYIGVKVSGFQEKVFFADVFLNECEIDKSNHIISGNEIYEFYINNKTDAYGKEINTYTDISIDFERQVLIITFDDGSIQIEDLEIY